MTISFGQCQYLLILPVSRGYYLLKEQLGVISVPDTSRWLRRLKLDEIGADSVSSKNLSPFCRTDGPSVGRGRAISGD